MNDWYYQIASDVIRDGLGLELLNKSDDVVAEVFRCDADHTVTVRVFEATVPEEKIRELVQESRKRLSPFEDGSPLPVEFIVCGET